MGVLGEEDGEQPRVGDGGLNSEVGTHGRENEDGEKECEEEKCGGTDKNVERKDEEKNEMEKSLGEEFASNADEKNFASMSEEKKKEEKLECAGSDRNNIINMRPAIPVTLKFQNLSYEVKVLGRKKGLKGYWGGSSKRWILRGINGDGSCGDMIALMGSSGAGKSTLLNILSGRLRKGVSGSITYNDCVLDEKYTELSCYIQQDDIFFGYLTVSEHLKSQIALRCPTRKATPKEQSPSIAEILSTFGLDKVAHSKIGNIHMGTRRGISGGEKKRLSVATELLTNPSLIFADEPTSGLDAYMALSVVSVLEALASQGKTIIATIHQPSTQIFEKFNQVALLAEGQIVYFGPREGALVYFVCYLGETCPVYTNPADFFIETLSIPSEPVAREAKLEQIRTWASLWSEQGPTFLSGWKQVRGISSLDPLFYVSHFSPPKFPNPENANNIDAEKENVGKIGVENVEKIGLKNVEKIGGENVEKMSEKEGNVEKIRNVKDVDELRKETVECKEDVRRGAYRTTYWRQFGILLARAFLNNSRNRMLFHARLVQTLVTSFVGGFVYFQLNTRDVASVNGACFYMVLTQAMVGALGVVQVFTNETPIALREVHSGLYATLPYYWAKVTSDLPFQIFNPLLFVFIIFYMIGVNMSARALGECLLYISLTTNAMISLGYVVSCIAPNAAAAIAIIPVLIMPLALLSGFLYFITEMSTFWLVVSYASPFRFGLSGVMTALWRGIRIRTCLPSDPAPCLETGEDVIKLYGFENDKLWLNSLILILHILIFRTLASILLLLKIKLQKSI